MVMRFRKKRKDVLEHYTKKQWFYVAMRIDRKALERDEVKKLKVGELQPIRFTFVAKEMVYPLKISSVNAGETEVLLYVLANSPMVLNGKLKPAGFSIESNLSRTVAWATDPQYGTYRKAFGNELPLTWEALGVRKDTGLSLCKYRTVYRTEQMTDDLTFTRFDPVSYWREELRKADDESWLRRRALSVLARHDESLLRKLAKDDDKYMRELAAGACGPGTPKELVQALARDADLGVRMALAQNYSIPQELLAELANDKDRFVRYAIARNRMTTPKTLWKLARDKDSMVRSHVARHPATPSKTLAELVQDKDSTVRYNLARRRNLPVAMLSILAADEGPYVRLGVAENPSTPHDVLQALARDKDPTVSIFAKSRLKSRAIDRQAP